jgi:hypothetical protein
MIDEPGKVHARDVANKLHGTAKRVRLLDLTTVWHEYGPKCDITDWLEGHEATELSEIIAKISDWIDVPPAADAADNPSHDTATTVPNSLACVVMASPQRDPRSS